MKVKILFSAILFFFSSYAHAQHLSYAKEIIDTLCAPYFSGRGYAYSGDARAAQYIRNEASKYTPHIETQEFFVSINSIVGKNALHVGTDSLQAGEDYHCAAFSKTVSGVFPFVVLDKNIINDSVKYTQFVHSDYSGHIVIIDTLGMANEAFAEAYPYITQLNLYGAAGMIALCEKLPAFVPAREQRDFFFLDGKRDKFNFNADSIEVHIEAEFAPKHKTQNLIAKLPGASDTAIVFTAHYDHIGTMGEQVYFPGAHDNASGTAAVLSLLNYFSQTDTYYTLYFIFFSAEEIGLLGSYYYVENPVFPLSKIKFLVNLDIVGSGSQGIQVVNGSVHNKEFQLLKEINRKRELLYDVKTRAAAANSDHYPFHEQGVKSFFIYTLGDYKEYHSVNDNADNVPLKAFNELIELLILFVQEI